MTMTTTNPAADELRLQRERLGLSRAQLASMADCSLSSLANIEQGCVPKRSSVLARVREVLAALERVSGGAG